MKTKPNTEAGAKRERGQAIVLLAVAILGLMASVGLATDGAAVYVTQRHLQRALDAAALAAANKLPDQPEARDAAYQLMRLHGYHFDPSGPTLDIDFPTFDPPRKVATVAAAVNRDLFFLNVVGWRTVRVPAEGWGESAPLDVFLVLDLSNSMAYDTPPPDWWWGGDRQDHCEGYLGVVSDVCVDLCKVGEWDYAFESCYCNVERNCDPLDVHIKESAKFFVDQLDSRYDRVGLVGYDREGITYQTLTDNFGLLKNMIDSMDAYTKTSTYFPDEYLCTNIGDGILYANVEMSQPPPSLGGTGGRIDSVWSTVLLTDGRANIYRDCPGCPDLCGGAGCGVLNCCPWTGYCPEANDWARDNAWSAWTLHKIVIYTIAYGDIFFDYPHYRELMIDIADIADNGEVDGDTDNFWAVPDEAGLRDALAEIAERIYTRLLR